MLYSGKSCDSPENHVPKKEIALLDQRKERKMFVGIDNTSHTKKELERTNHKRKRMVIKQERLCTSGNSSSDLAVPSKLWKKNTKVKYQVSDSESDWS